MTQYFINEAAACAESAKERQDPRNYVEIRKSINQLIACEGVYLSGNRIMGTSYEDCVLEVYIEMSKNAKIML